jgi:hypothetical protein
MVDYTSQIKSILSQNDALKDGYTANVALSDGLSTKAEVKRSQIANATTTEDITKYTNELQALNQQISALANTMQTQLKTLYDNAGKISDLQSKDQAQNIDNTSKAQQSVVKSGSGDSAVKLVDIPASQYALNTLSVDNAALLNTNTTLTYTQKAKISKEQLNLADHNYTTAMNVLSGYQSALDTSSPGYEAAKISAIEAQAKWELARDGLERVTVEDKSGAGSTAISGSLGPDPSARETELTNIDLTGTSGDLTASADPTEPVTSDEIVVAGRRGLDQRIKFKFKRANEDLYGDENSVLYQLKTDGVFFPYTPSVTYNHKATYSEMNPTHSNTSYQIYINSPAPTITISGQFTAQNLEEARYTLAAMHFFRTVTKMHFGSTDPDAGLPPPVLQLSGYGDFMFNNLSVIVSDFQMDLPADVDYIEVDIKGKYAWVPAVTTFSVTCVVQQTPAQQRDIFNFNEFASGELMSLGGFL